MTTEPAHCTAAAAHKLIVPTFQPKLFKVDSQANHPALRDTGITGGRHKGLAAN